MKWNVCKVTVTADCRCVGIHENEAWACRACGAWHPGPCKGHQERRKS